MNWKILTAIVVLITVAVAGCTGTTTTIDAKYKVGDIVQPDRSDVKLYNENVAFLIIGFNETHYVVDALIRTSPNHVWERVWGERYDISRKDVESLYMKLNSLKDLDSIETWNPTTIDAKYFIGDVVQVDRSNVKLYNENLATLVVGFNATHYDYDFITRSPPDYDWVILSGYRSSTTHAVFEDLYPQLIGWENPSSLEMQTSVPAPTKPFAPAPTVKPDTATLGEKNAADAALRYLKYMSFSREGLIDQLEFEGYTHQEAVYGVDQSGADWNEQAAKTAEQYLKYMSFSRSGLIDQLEFEGFTPQQAEYGVRAVGY